MKILRVWLIAICLSATSWSIESDLEKKIAELARSPQWLGHFFYDGEADRYSSLVDSPHYFLSKTGRYNPEDELKEVIRVLSTGDDLPEETYCHNVGRFELVLSWFPEYRKPGHICKAFNQWQEKLSIDEVRLSFATGYMKNPASSFGHLFLKLVSKKQKAESLNYGINFSAHTGADTGALYALKGLFGQYRGAFSFLPYHQLIKDYSDLEGRDIWELDLNLDAEARLRLLRFIYEFDSNYIDYTFANNNCAGVLERLVHYLQRRPLNKLRELKPWTIPLESFQEIAGGVDQKRFYFISSLKTQLADMESQLTLEEKKKIKHEHASKSFETLSAREIDYVILDRKLNEQYPDGSYDLELMKARSRMTADPDFTSPLSPHPQSTLLEAPKTGSFGVYGAKDDIGIEANLLTERLIYGRSLSEINMLNIRTQSNTSEKPRSILKEIEVFSFLAGESVNFLRSPLSYGVGIFYRDKVDLVAEGTLGFQFKKGPWLYFPKLRGEVGKAKNQVAPEMDLFYFSTYLNSKLTVNHQNWSLELFRYFDSRYGVNISNVYDIGLKKTSDTRIGALVFF